jgi:hypothetical protein
VATNGLSKVNFATTKNPPLIKGEKKGILYNLGQLQSKLCNYNKSLLA